MTIAIQRCTACGAVNYPVRTLCRHCLADALVVVDDAATGVVLAAATLHRSFEAVYTDKLPLRIGTVRLDSGPHLIAFVAQHTDVGDTVRLEDGVNPLGDPVWYALPA